MKRTGKFIKAMAAAMAALALAACGQQEDDGSAEERRAAAEAKARLDQSKRAVYEKLKGSYTVYTLGFGNPEYCGEFNDITIKDIKIEGGGHITLNGTERIDLEIPGNILSYEEFSESTKINLVFATNARADKNIENGFAVKLGTHGWFYIYKSTVMSGDLIIKQRWKDGSNQHTNEYNKAAGFGGGGEDPSPALGFDLEGTWSGQAGSASLEIGADGALSVSKKTGAMTYSDCSWSASGSTVTFRMKVSSVAGNTSTTIEIEDSFTASSSDSGETMTLTLVKSRTKTTVGGSATESESANASQMLLSVLNLPQAKSVTLTKSDR